MNCWHALWQLRYHGVDSCLWIDSISIDQENLDEKSVQVAHMGGIFSNASWVAACIGAGNATADLLSSPPTHRFEDVLALWQDLGRRDYWHRAWIWQEIVLAKEVRLYCGHDAFYWIILEHFWHRPWQLDEATTSSDKSNAPDSDEEETHQDVLRKSAIHMSQLIDLRLAQRMGHWTMGMMSASSVLKRFGDLRCENPRDKIYSMLSLLPADDLIARSIRPKYSHSLFEFFLELQRVMLDSRCFRGGEGPMNLLCDISKWFQIHASQSVVLDWLLGSDVGLDLSEPKLCIETTKTRLPLHATVVRIAPIVSRQDAHYVIDSASRDDDNDDLGQLRGIDDIAVVSGRTLLEHLKPHRARKMELDHKHKHKHVRMLSAFVDWSSITTSHHSMRLASFEHRLLVHEDIRLGDVFAMMHCHVGIWSRDHVECIHAILRPIRDASSGKISYILHSWALPVSGKTPDEALKSYFDETIVRNLTLRQKPSLTSKVARDSFSRSTSFDIGLPARQVTRFLLLNAEPLEALCESEVIRARAYFDESVSAIIESHVQAVLNKLSAS